MKQAMPNHEPDFRTVSVWLGAFESETRLDRFFEETYDEEDEDAPISEFAHSQEQVFYDHDFIERGFNQSAQTVQQLLTGHSFSRSFVDVLTAAAGESLPAGTNSVVLVWGRVIRVPRSVAGLGHELQFIGTFPCDPRADAI